MTVNEKGSRLTYPWRWLILFLPLTLISTVLAIGSVTLHQYEMRRHLPEPAWSIASDPLLELTLVAPLALIPPLLLSAGTLRFLSREVIQPLQQLETRAIALTWGNFEAIKEPVGGIAEIQHLQRELMEMARKVQAAQMGLRDYIGAITAAQEEERTRLARELHDDTLQSIIALKQRLQLNKKLAQDDRLQESLHELEHLTEQTIENLRRFTRALRPIYLEDLGLVTALDMLAREMAQANDLTVTFHAVGPQRRLKPEVELSLYRIAQESLSNVVRHSNATHADLTLNFLPDSVELTVSDNGIGFNVPQSPTDLAPAGHFGLLGIHERVKLIGGWLEIESAAGKGSRIRVRV